MTAADYIKPDSKATATKQQAIESLQKRVVMQQQQLRNIDPRLEVSIHAPTWGATV